MSLELDVTFCILQNEQENRKMNNTFGTCDSSLPDVSCLKKNYNINVPCGLESALEDTAVSGGRYADDSACVKNIQMHSFVAVCTDG